MFNLRGIASGSLHHHLWKRETQMARIVVARFSSSSADNANGSVITTPAFPTGNKLPSSRSAVADRSCIFGKLQSLFTETLDYITREEEENKGGVTKEDIVQLAKQLNKDGKFEYALEIFEWMDKKKMEFSPWELAFFVDLIARTKGIDAAKEYFNQVEPDFDRTNTRAKNWPAFATIMLMENLFVSVFYIELA